MPTIMTHAVVPLALAVAVGPVRISREVALMGAALAILPDADVFGLAMGVQYGDEWGHRGATHSLVFAAIVAGLLSAIWKPARSFGAFLFLTFATASHGLLDAFTDGGLGIALLWPFDLERYFAPITPIRVSPIGAGFLSMRGLETLLSEIKWIWLPCAVFALAVLGVRRAARARS